MESENDNYVSIDFGRFDDDGMATTVSETASETSSVNSLDMGGGSGVDANEYDVCFNPHGGAAGLSLDDYERRSSAGAGRGQEHPRRGTSQQMQEYFEQRLKLALTNCRQLQMQLDENVLNELIHNILHNSMQNCSLENRRPISIEETPQEQRSSITHSLEGIALNPLYTYALDAWHILTTARASGHFQNHVFPSQMSVDALCELIVAGVSAGVVFGFEAVTEN